jgi:Na+/proline symporter
LIVLSAAVATAYTAVGGMRAVLWTDAAQFVVLLGAIMAALGVTAERAGGFAAMWSTVRDAGGLAPFVPRDPQFLSWDPRIRITLGSAIIGTFVAFLARYVADQSIVQRYVAAKSLAAARRGFVWNVVGALLSIGMLLVLGVAVHANALLDPQLGAKPVAAQLAFLIKNLPPGALGLVTAGLLAATMSSLDSGLHSCTTSLQADWRTGPGGGLGSARAGKWLVVALGVVSTLLALAAQGLGDLFMLANRVVNGMGSPLLALMLGAMLPLGATRHGLFWGTVLGTVASVVLTACVEPLAIHHYATMNLAVTALAVAAVSVLDRVIARRRCCCNASVSGVRAEERPTSAEKRHVRMFRIRRTSGWGDAS